MLNRVYRTFEGTAPEPWKGDPMSAQDETYFIVFEPWLKKNGSASEFPGSHPRRISQVSGNGRK